MSDFEFEDDGGETWALVMPFVACQSQGGPFDDDAFVAGFNMGKLDTELKAKPDFLRSIVTRQTRDQVDLIALSNGYMATFTDADEQWSNVEFVAMSPRLDA